MIVDWIDFEEEILNDQDIIYYLLTNDFESNYLRFLII